MFTGRSLSLQPGRPSRQPHTHAWLARHRGRRIIEQARSSVDATASGHLHRVSRTHARTRAHVQQLHGRSNLFVVTQLRGCCNQGSPMPADCRHHLRVINIVHTHVSTTVGTSKNSAYPASQKGKNPRRKVLYKNSCRTVH